jgi:hypothetical protein
VRRLAPGVPVRARVAPGGVESLPAAQVLFVRPRAEAPRAVVLARGCPFGRRLGSRADLPRAPDGPGAARGAIKPPRARLIEAPKRSLRPRGHSVRPMVRWSSTPASHKASSRSRASKGRSCSMLGRAPASAVERALVLIAVDQAGEAVTVGQAVGAHLLAHGLAATRTDRLLQTRRDDLCFSLREHPAFVGKGLDLPGRSRASLVFRRSVTSSSRSMRRTLFALASLRAGCVKRLFSPPSRRRSRIEAVPRVDLPPTRLRGYIDFADTACWMAGTPTFFRYRFACTIVRVPFFRITRSPP